MPETVLITIYKTLILPHLNYGILLWGFNSDQLFKLQKRLVRIIKLKKYNAHTDPLFKDLKILKIKDMFIQNELKFLFKLENNLLPQNISNFFNKNENTRYNIRRLAKYQIPRVKHAFADKCLRVSIPILLRDFPSIVTDKLYTHSFKGFSDYLKQYFINNYESQCSAQNCYVCNT